MDASTVRRVMEMIPERTARQQSGSAFAADCPGHHAGRLAHLVRFLHWMSPLEALPREDQQALGLLNAAGRPVHAADLEEEDGEALAEETPPREPESIPA
jgi:hypothetical protein